MGVCTNKVIILLSDKRSGSTFFQEMLKGRNEISSVKFTPHSNGETHFWTMAATILDDDKMNKQTIFNKYNGYGNVSVTRTLLNRLLLENGVELDREILTVEDIFYYWEKLIESVNSLFFFEKSPQLIASFPAVLLLVKWLKITQKEVFIYGLVRNPFAVMNSAYELFGTNPELRQFGWLDAYRNLFFIKGLLDEHAVEIIRYEDLVDEPALIFGQISSRLGIDVWDSKSFKSIRPDSVNRWQNSSLLNNGLNMYVEILANFVGYHNHIGSGDSEIKDLKKFGKFNRFKRYVKAIKSKVYYRYIKNVKLAFDEFKKNNTGNSS
jgi:hypothetical protein